MSYDSKNGKIWCIEGCGNDLELYQLDTLGVLEKTILIDDAPNIDWEDITKDQQGNLYIGDFGNNDNNRKNLCIYKIKKEDLTKGSTAPSYKISFSYPEQRDFLPKKKNLLFDVERFF